MDNETVINGIITLLSSSFGALIGGYCAFRIAIWQLKSTQKSDLEKDVEPFFLEIKIECEKMLWIYTQVQALKQEKLSADEWKKKCLQKIKNNKYRIVDLRNSWMKVRSSIFRYSYNKNNSEQLYREIQLLVDELSYLCRSQDHAEEKIEQDTTCIWLDEEMEKICEIISHIDPEISNKFFTAMDTRDAKSKNVPI